MRRAIAISILALVLVLPAPALAGTLSYDGQTIAFTAGPGEKNSITVTLQTVGPDKGKILVGDYNPMTIAPGSNCQLAPNKTDIAYCQAPTTATVRATLADGDDRYGSDLQGPSIVDGGDGNDNLHGGDSDDQLSGGPGDDSFFPDIHDPLKPESNNGRDVVSGGDGNDSVSYISHAAPLNVSLNDVADDGIPGEGDNVGSDVEKVSGTDAGPNTLTGSAAKNWLSGGEQADVIIGGDGDDFLPHSGGDDRMEGGPGADSVEGGAGNDRLDGGPGVDQVIGGDGNDHLNIRDGEPFDHTVSCGPGTDTVLADPFAVNMLQWEVSTNGLKKDCERIDLPRVPPLILSLQHDRKRKHALLGMACPGAPCAGTISVRTAKRGRRRPVTLTRFRFSVAAGSSGVFRRRLGRKARRLVRKPVRCTVTITARPGGERVRKTLVMRREKRRKPVRRSSVLPARSLSLADL